MFEEKINLDLLKDKTWINVNKNKMILFVVLGLLLFTAILIAFTLKTDTSDWKISKTNWPLYVWMIGWNSKSNSEIIKNFQDSDPLYSNQSIIIQNFYSYKSYYDALILSFIQWDTPDIFVLNNSEYYPLFTSQVAWINPAYVSPSKFRTTYEWVFSDDLILSKWTWRDRVDFLAWLPMWYETLWIFYNRKYVKSKDVSSLSSINNLMSELKRKKPNIAPVWIWNGSTVIDSWDIITQFFMFNEDVLSIADLTWKLLKEAFGIYFLYWDINWYNGYNRKFSDLYNNWLNAVDLFTKGETYILFWYPSLLKNIKESSFNKNLLLAAPFPHFYSWIGNTLLNYNYFTIHKNTDNITLSNEFLRFLSTDEWSKIYLEHFPFLYPAKQSLIDERLEKKIDDEYNVVLNDFYNPDAKLKTFDKWLKNYYDDKIVKILDNPDNYELEFKKLINSISICKSHFCRWGNPIMKSTDTLLNQTSLILLRAFIISHFSPLPISTKLSLFKVWTHILSLLIHTFFHDSKFCFVTVIGVASIFISILGSNPYLFLITHRIFKNCEYNKTLGVHPPK